MIVTEGIARLRGDFSNLVVMPGGSEPIFSSGFSFFHRF
jgi:hypothetical protein